MRPTKLLTGELIYKFAGHPVAWSTHAGSAVETCFNYVALEVNTAAMNSLNLTGQTEPDTWDVEYFYECFWRYNWNLHYKQVPLLEAWSATALGTKLYVDKIWKQIQGYWWGYQTPAVEEGENDIAVGQKWKLKASGHVAEVKAISGSLVTIRYNRTEVELEKEDLKKNATKL